MTAITFWTCWRLAHRSAIRWTWLQFTHRVELKETTNDLSCQWSFSFTYAHVDVCFHAVCEWPPSSQMDCSMSAAASSNKGFSTARALYQSCGSHMHKWETTHRAHIILRVGFLIVDYAFREYYCNCYETFHVFKEHTGLLFLTRLRRPGIQLITSKQIYVTNHWREADPRVSVRQNK